MAPLSPSSFLNPLGPVEWSYGVGKQIGGAARSGVEDAIASLKSGTDGLVARAERDAAKTYRVIAKPAVDIGHEVGQGFSEAGRGLFYMGDQVKEGTKKVLIGQAVVIGVSILGLGLTVWLATRKNTPSVTRILFGRANEGE